VQAALRFWLAAITLAAVAAVWFWVLPPVLTPLVFPSPTSWTDADIGRHLWHVRLIQPEWVSSPPQHDDYLRWAQVETAARFDVVFLGWLGGSFFLHCRLVAVAAKSQYKVTPRAKGPLSSAPVNPSQSMSCVDWAQVENRPAP
jgi:hypothetical protein